MMSWKTWLNNLSQKAASTRGTCNRVWSCSTFHLPWRSARWPDFGKKACETWWIGEIEKESSWFRCYSSCREPVQGRLQNLSMYLLLHSIKVCICGVWMSCESLLQVLLLLYLGWYVGRRQSLDFSLNPHAVPWSPSFRPWFPLLLSELWGESLEAC